MDCAWSELPAGDAADWVARVDARLGEQPYVPERFLIHHKPLSFYDGHHLYRLTQPENEFAKFDIYIVDGPKQTVILNGTNGPIYDLNEQVPIKLSPSNVCDYIRFFFGFARGRHGYFYIVESVVDLRFEDGADPETQTQIATIVKPISPDIGNKGYRADCTFFFQKALFACPVIVYNNGLVDMHDEELLLSDLDATPIERIR